MVKSSMIATAKGEEEVEPRGGEVDEGGTGLEKDVEAVAGEEVEDEVEEEGERGSKDEVRRTLTSRSFTSFRSLRLIPLLPLLRELVSLLMARVEGDELIERE